jgi:tetratricopeptide (TPR) repeat protein
MLRPVAEMASIGLRFIAVVVLALGGVCSVLAQPEELAAKSEQAKKAMAAGRFAEAIPLYEQLVAAVPNNPGLLTNLGMAQHMAGRDREAIAQFDAALKIDPSIVPASIFKGVSHLRLGQPDKAAAPLERAVKALPQDFELNRMLGDALAGTGRHEAAAERYGKAAAIDPNKPAAWFGLGGAYEALAQAEFEKLTAADPESPYVWLLVGEARAKQQQYSGAFFLFRKAAEALPRMRGIHASLAAVYRQTGHADWAVAEEAKEARIPPADCAAYPAECHFAAGRFQDALATVKGQTRAEARYWRARAYNELAFEAFDKVTKLPKSVEYHRVMGELNDNQGRYLDAVKEWRAALELAPGDPGLMNNLAIDLYRSRDYAAASEVIEKLLKIAPNDPQLNYLRGDILLLEQRAEEAIPWLERAVKGDGELLQARSSLGRALMQTGKAEAAVAHLERALPVDNDGSLRFQLARAYQAAGRREEAAKTMADYQKIQQELQAQKEKLSEEIQITAPE